MYTIKNQFEQIVIDKNHKEFEELHIENEIKYLSVGDTVKGKYEYTVISKGVVIVHSTFSGFTPRWDVVLRRKY